MINKVIQPDSVLSFSAGSSSLDPWAFRVVPDEKSDKIKRFAELFPAFAPLLSQSPPLVINCYPASIGTFSGTVFVDTYLKIETFCRALLLAAELNTVAIVLGQPLSTLDLFLQYLQRGLPLPQVVVFCLGGYPCPLSLENYLKSSARSHNCNGIIVHAYGVGEVDAACLVGVSRSDEGKVLYVPVTDRIRPVVNGKKFLLGISDSDDLIDTGDEANRVGSFFTITNSPNRVNPELLSKLNNWDESLWQLRTGYTAMEDSRTVFQCRIGASPTGEDEMDFFVFASRFGFSWLDKPNWSLL